MKHNWKLTFTFEAGCLIANSMIDRLKKFCFENDINVKFFKTGFLMKEVSVKMTGCHTDNEINNFKYSIEQWGKSLENR